VRQTLAFVSMCVVAAACTSTDDGDGDDDGTSSSPSGSGSGAGGGGGSSNDSCPPNVYPGIPCDTAQMGVTCAGVSSCFCGDEGVTVDTTCVCKESESLGVAWHCGDECAQSCDATGGTGGAG
jgi:hypothetical protein